jgi:hypothetical protein
VPLLGTFLALAAVFAVVISPSPEEPFSSRTAGFPLCAGAGFLLGLAALLFISGTDDREPWGFRVEEWRNILRVPAGRIILDRIFLAGFQAAAVLFVVFPVLTAAAAAVGISLEGLAGTAGRITLLLAAFRGYALMVTTLTERRLWLRYILLWAPPLSFILITPRLTPAFNPALLAARVYTNIPVRVFLPYAVLLITAPAAAAAALLIKSGRAGAPDGGEGGSP